MRTRTLIALLAGLAVLVALAVAVSISQRQGNGTGQPLLPDLKQKLNDVDRIVVTTGGNKTIATMALGKDGWTLAERDNYPADIGRIRKNLIALSEARILEEKTSNPELYDRLRVDDVEKESAAGMRLDLSVGGKITSVVIGTTGVGGGNAAYARRSGEATSWLISGDFDLPSDTSGWLDRRVMDIAADRVHSVTITQPDGAVVRIEKAAPGEGEFQVLDVPPGHQLVYPAVGNPVGAALAALDTDDVAPASGFDPEKVQPVVARFETFDGLVVEASSYKLPSGVRVIFSATADKALAERLAPKATAEQEPKSAEEATAKPAAEAQKSFDEVQSEADQINAKVGQWVYTLPVFKSDQLTRTIDDVAPKLKGPASGKR